MEHLWGEDDGGGLVGVLLREGEGELEVAALPGGVGGALDDGLPLEQVVLV